MNYLKNSVSKEHNLMYNKKNEREGYFRSTAEKPKESGKQVGVSLKKRGSAAMHRREGRQLIWM